MMLLMPQVRCNCGMSEIVHIHVQVPQLTCFFPKNTLRDAKCLGQCSESGLDLVLILKPGQLEFDSHLGIARRAHHCLRTLY